MEDTFDKLWKIRVRMQELMRVQESIARLGSMYKSPSLDGMPKGAGGGDAMDRRLCAQEEMQRRAEEIRKEIKELDEEVRPEMKDLPETLHTFCTVYFLAACSVLEVCRIMQKAKNTVLGYRKEVREFYKGKN